MSELIRENKTEFLECIQLLRVFAAIGVMLSHIGFGDSYINQISFSAGVNIFFCISGFLMMYTTQNSVPQDFLIRRLIRLVPLYWILTIMTFLAALVVKNIWTTEIEFSELIKSLFFIPYFREGLKTGSVVRPIVGPAWTLRFDIWFLFIFAIAMKLSHKWRGLISGFLCLFLVILGNFMHDKTAFSSFFGKSFWLNYIAGILVFYIWKWAEEKTEFKKRFSTLWVSVSIVCFAILYISKIPDYLCVFLSFCVLISVLLVFEKKRMPKSVMYFGKISYSFYLTHYYVILIVDKFFDLETLSFATVLLTVGVFAISLIVAHITYCLIEIKFGKLLEKFYLKFKKCIT